MSELAADAVAETNTGTRGKAVFRNLDQLTAAIHMSPETTHVVIGGGSFSLALLGTFQDARIFQLRLPLPADHFHFVGLRPGANASLSLMPHNWSGDTLILDGFFHPNFSGTDTLAFLELQPVMETGGWRHVTVGQSRGYGGTSSAPEILDIVSDSAAIDVDGVPAFAPGRLIIQRLEHEGRVDSVKLHWNRVDGDEAGFPVYSPLYRVYLTDVLRNVTVLKGVTADTVFVDTDPTAGIPGGGSGSVIYDVRAVKTRPWQEP